MNDPLAVLVVHPYGVAHRGYITREYTNGYYIQWVPPLPTRQPVRSYFIRYADRDITWLSGFEHSAGAIKALCAAAALAGEDD